MDFLEIILKNIKQSQVIVLATVIYQTGSTPRGTGTRFLIHEDGSTTGTIGGGLVEAEVIAAAKEVFNTGKAIIHHYDMSQQHLNSNAMICGGEMTILIEPIHVTSQNLTFYESLQSVHRKREKSLFIIGMTKQEDDYYQLSHFLVNATETISDGEPLPTEIMQQFSQEPPPVTASMTQTIGDTDYWMESVAFPNRLYLFGAGHVSRPTAYLGHMAGFRTVVIDDRKELLSPEYFDDAISLIEVKEFKDCIKDLEIGTDSFLVILTRSHSHDRQVLAQALKTEAMYIGMIGSRRKRNTIYNLLLKEDHFSQLDLDRVHSPIGLSIGAETPEEIAISIVAELVQVRANRK